MPKRAYQEDKNIRRSILSSVIIAAVFIILRLVNVTSWSWWAVTAPLWGTFTYLILAGMVHALLGRIDRRMIFACVGLSGIINLSVVFFVLRLLSVINWNWWVIAIPLLVGGGLMIITGLRYAAYRASNKEENSN